MLEGLESAAATDEVYRPKLKQLVDKRRSEYFDALAIPTRYIKEALSETGG